MFLVALIIFLMSLMCSNMIHLSWMTVLTFIEEPISNLAKDVKGCVQEIFLWLRSMDALSKEAT